MPGGVTSASCTVSKMTAITPSPLDGTITISRMGKTMTKKGPGKSFRRGLTLLEVADMFRDEDRAREWLGYLRWPHGPCCPECGSLVTSSLVSSTGP